MMVLKSMSTVGNMAVAKAHNENTEPRQIRKRLPAMAIRIFFFIIAWMASVAQADILVGRVVKVSDGDTLTILNMQNQQFKIRLAGIDAPEKKQAFGERAKQHLANMTFNRPVTVEWEKTDRYQRIVGKVLINGNDINIEQIKAGLAWWYEKYRKEQSPSDQRQYAEAEQLARQQRVGIWQESNPIPPWEWRHRTP